MVIGVEDGEEDEARRAGNGEEDGDYAENFLCGRGIWCKTSSMAEPAVGEEGEVEKYSCYTAAGDE